MFIRDTPGGPVYRNPNQREMRELRKYSGRQIVEGAGVIRGIYSVERRWFELWADPNWTHEMGGRDHKAREGREDRLYWFYWYVRDSYLHPLPYATDGPNKMLVAKMMRQGWVRVSGLHLPPPGYAEPHSKGEEVYRLRYE